MKKLLRSVTASTAFILLAATGSAGATSISNTGPFSYNSIYTHNSTYYKKTNNNNVSVYNANYQFAKSGSATVFGNTFGGAAVTGNASNYNSTNTWVYIHN